MSFRQLKNDPFQATMNSGTMKVSYTIMEREVIL